MFTIGRDREKRHAGKYIRDPKNFSIVHNVIDAVHDCLEGSEDDDSVRQVFRDAFFEGGSGAWEQAGSWLRKLCSEYPRFSDIWTELAKHPKVDVRFHAAAFVVDMPDGVFPEMLQYFSHDRSKKIRLKISGDLWVSPRHDARPILEEWLTYEPDQEVSSEVRRAIEAQQTD